MAKISWSDDYTEALIGLLPLDNDDVYVFTPDSFRDKQVPDELKPKFHVRQWNNGEADKFREILRQQASGSKKKNKKSDRDLTLDLIEEAVLDIRDLWNPIKRVQIEYQGRKTLESLPESLLIEIMMKLAEISGF